MLNWWCRMPGEGGESAKPIDCGAWAGIMGSDWVINMPWDLQSFRGVKGFSCRASAKRGFGL